MRTISRLICIAVLICASTSMFSQYGFHFGFRAGLNFSNVSGPSELANNGAELEKFKNGTGFHVGLTTRIGITETFGVSADLLYTQKGGKQQFDGLGYFLYQTGDVPKVATGPKTQSITLTNGYLELPLSLYYRPLKWLELHAGAQASLLVNSRAQGELKFKGDNPVTAQMEVNLDYNYHKNGAYQTGTYAGKASTEINVDGRIVQVPNILEAYYFYNEKPADLYERFDWGLNAGANIYISRSLFIGARYFWGLTDITNNKVDVSLGSINVNQLITRDDKDKNRTLQVTVGFVF